MNRLTVDKMQQSSIELNSLLFEEHPEVFSKYYSVVFLDTETTGLDPKKDNIIELACLVYHRINDPLHPYPAPNFELTDSLSTLIKLPEGKSVPDFITNINHITDKDLQERGNEAHTVFQYLTNNLTFANHGNASLVVAYNADFDLRFLFSEFQNRGREGNLRILQEVDVLDPLTVMRARYPNEHHKLGEALAKFNIEGAVNDHTALHDTEALLKLTQALQKEKPDLNEYINELTYRAKYGIPDSDNRLSDPKFRYFDEDEIVGWHYGLNNPTEGKEI